MQNSVLIHQLPCLSNLEKLQCKGSALKNFTMFSRFFFFFTMEEQNKLFSTNNNVCVIKYFPSPFWEYNACGNQFRNNRDTASSRQLGLPLLINLSQSSS